MLFIVMNERIEAHGEDLRYPRSVAEIGQGIAGFSFRYGLPGYADLLGELLLCEAMPHSK